MAHTKNHAHESSMFCSPVLLFSCAPVLLGMYDAQYEDNALTILCVNDTTRVVHVVWTDTDWWCHVPGVWHAAQKHGAETSQNDTVEGVFLGH